MKKSAKARRRAARLDRRRRIAEAHAAGQTVPEIAAQFRLAERTVRRDLEVLRRAAAERRPWGEPATCRAAFIEAAEGALQKTRAAQHAAKPDSTLRHHYLKLEWTMLVKFIEMTTQLAQAESEGHDHDEDEDWTTYTTDELLAKARELGIDLSRFERALRPADAEPPDPGRAGDRDPAA
jgi:hypothetical protein